MGEASVIERDASRVEVCLEADGIAPDRLQFTISEKDRIQRITRVRVSSCKPS